MEGEAPSEPLTAARLLSARTEARQNNGDANMTPPSSTDPLAAVPLRPGNVELRRDSRGLAQLRLSRAPAGRLTRTVAGWLRHNFTRTVELDEAGTMYFDLVDGKRALREIASALADRTGRPTAEVEAAVTAFTRQLMTKNLIWLKVPAPAPPAPASPTPGCS